MKRWHWIALVVLLLVAGGGAVVALRKFSETEEDRLSTLLPQVRAAFLQLAAALGARGIKVWVISTRRTADQQAAKVASGVSGTTNSWHTLGRALDVEIGIEKDGKVVHDSKGENLRDYKILHEEAKRFGFRGIPNGSPFTADGKKAYIKNAAGKEIWDVFHIEFPEGMTFAQAKARAGVTA